MQRRLFAWADRACLPLMAAVATVTTALNFYAAHNFHTIEKHLVFRERILHGFATTDVVPSYPIPPTFPMWGYGFVLLLTTHKLALIAIHFAVALFSVWYFLKVVDETAVINEWSRFWLRVFMVCCVPWYAYHSIDWAQSLATSFLVLSVSLLMVAVHRGPIARNALCASAICLGINLNFASDLYLLPVALAITYWWCAGFSRVSLGRGAAWLVVVMATLIPWMIYSWSATGEPLMKSTNQGHVMLIGLGQDPRHRFPTTYSDDDPWMYQRLRDELGDNFARRFYASCSYEADRVLRPAFVRMIARQPYDYLDLIRLKLVRILTGDIGTYAGEFDQGGNEGRFGIGNRVRNRLQRYSVASGRALQRGTTVFAAFAIWAGIRSRKRAWMLLLVTIAYQYLSCSVAALQPQYISNLILFQLLVCAHGVGVLSSSLDAMASGGPVHLEPPPPPSSAMRPRPNFWVAYPTIKPTMEPGSMISSQ